MNDSLTDRLRPEDGFVVTHFLTVAEITSCYQTWRASGAEFITGQGPRRRDSLLHARSDGYIIEVGRARAG